ncbi:MAG: hypothetical protein AB7R90_16045 [Reyranellaceae bacterium]
MSTPQTSIVRQERFLRAEQCAELIAHTVDNLPAKAMRSPDTIFSGLYIDAPDSPLALAAGRRAATLLSLAFGARLRLEVYQLVMWPQGMEQPVHIDKRRETTSHAAIVYLNDDFLGGQTYFPDIHEEVQPQRGLLAAFPGRALPHGVRKVERGMRHTLALWFMPA